MQNFYKSVLDIAEEYKVFKSIKEKEEFCREVEEAAFLNPDLPIDFVAGTLLSMKYDELKEEGFIIPSYKKS